MIKIILADDQVILRDSLKFIIEQDSDIRVLDTVNNGKEAFEACIKLNPDIVLMDIMMPDCNGIDGTYLIKNKLPDIKILILTTFDDDLNVSLALKNGADGYILKDINPAELITSIKNVYNGLVVMNKNVFARAIKAPNEASDVSKLTTTTSKNINATTDNTNAYNTNTTNVKNLNNNAFDINLNLTERELSIIRLIVDGKNNKELSQELFLSEGTIKNIITTILEKLKLRDRTQLAIFAIKNNLIW